MAATAEPRLLRPPHDLQTEEDAISALLAGGSCELLSPEDFDSNRSRALFEVIRSLERAGEQHDAIAVRAELVRRNASQDLHDVLRESLGDGVGAATLPHLAGTLKALRRRRELWQVGHAAVGAAESGEDVDAVSERLTATLAPGHDAARPDRLGVRSVVEVAEDLLRGGPAEWLAEGLLPLGDDVVAGGEDKSGKSWSVQDLAVSVATGTPLFGRFACTQGPVLMLSGEGGKRRTMRRVEAIVRDRGLLIEQAELRVAFRVPQLKDPAELAALRAEVEQHPPRLIILDPLYLAAAGAHGSDLYEMGAVLGGLQAVAQDVGASLVVSTHWNKTGVGSGPQRFTGVGPSAWGRVLVSIDQEQRPRPGPDGGTTALLRFDVSGEVEPTSFRVRRTIRAEDPNDLDSPLLYHCEVTEQDAEMVSPSSAPNRSEERILAVLGGQDSPLTVLEIGDRLAHDDRGRPLQARTIQKALHRLSDAGQADGDSDGSGTAGRWWRV